jgi:hypothetical protein
MTASTQRGDMSIHVFAQLAWLLPWQPTDDAALVAELQRELSSHHPLYQQAVVVVGRRIDSDDVVFYLPQMASPVAVVHLTWSGRREAGSWPSTRLYASVADWVQQCMLADHNTYLDQSLG